METAPIKPTKKPKQLWNSKNIFYKHQLKWIAPIWITAFITAIFAPKTVLNNNPLLKEYVSTIVKITSIGERHTRDSSSLEVAALCHAIIFWQIPFVFFMMWKYLHSQINLRDELFYKKSPTIIDRLQIIIVVIFWMICLFFSLHFDIEPKAENISKPFQKIQLALLESIIQSLAIGMFSAILAFGTKRLFTLNIKGSD